MTPTEEKAAAAAIRLAEELGDQDWSLRCGSMCLGKDGNGLFVAYRLRASDLTFPHVSTMPEAVAALRQRDAEREE